jgi:hypothetical protein
VFGHLGKLKIFCHCKVKDMLNTVQYNDRYVQAKHIDDALGRSRIVAISAVCAMGKSTAIRKWLAANGNPPVCFIACRIVHSIDGSATYNLTNYKSDDAVSSRCISTTVHSLNKFTKWVSENSDGVLILDELRSTLSSICDKRTFQERGQLALLGQMMGRMRVIAADADLLCDGMCETFLCSFGSVQLLDYTQRPLPRTIEAVCGKGGDIYWTDCWRRMVQHGCNLFLHVNSKERAICIARWCEKHNAEYKLYTGDNDSDSKDDFKNPDEAWRYVQVIIATATLTVAVDPKKWHCDAVFVFAGNGYGCSPRDQRQAVERFGRQGHGNGDGQISTSNGCNGNGVYVITHFKLPSHGEPNLDKEELFNAKLTEMKYITQRKRRYMHERFHAETLSSVNTTPEWFVKVLAHDAVEKLAYEYYLISEWQSMCRHRGWDFCMRTEYDVVPALEEFDHGAIRSVPQKLHDLINSKTITLSSKNGKKYEQAMTVFDCHCVIEEIVNKVTGEDPLNPRDVLDQIREENTPNSLLTDISKNLYLFADPLSPDEYATFTSHTGQFHEQRNLRTKSIEELNSMDQQKACVVEMINLRQGRTEAFMRACRVLGVAWSDLFTGSTSIPHPSVFEIDHKFDDATNFAYPLRQCIRDWATYTDTTLKATAYKSEMHTGMERMLGSFGLLFKVKKTRKRNADERVRTIVSADIQPNDITAIVEKSLVKQNGSWVPLLEYEPEEFIKEHKYDGPTVGARAGHEYEELVDRDALIAIQITSQTEVDRLEALHPANERAHSKLLKKRRGQLTNLNNLITEITDGRVLRTTYHRCFADRGRRYSNGPSLQKCSRVVRATSSRFYFDVDMMNAHPAIIAHLIAEQEAEADYPSLVRYGTAEEDEREAILYEIMIIWQCTRSQAKQLLVTLINTGTVSDWQWKARLLEVPAVQWPRFVHAYAAEAIRFTHVMADKHPDIVELSRRHRDSTKKRDPELYHRSSALNVTMQDHEDRILSIMETHAADAGWQFDCLIYDGALLRRHAGASEADVAALIASMQADIFVQTHIPMKLKVKNMSSQ